MASSDPFYHMVKAAYQTQFRRLVDDYEAGLLPGTEPLHLRWNRLLIFWLRAIDPLYSDANPPTPTRQHLDYFLRLERLRQLTFKRASEHFARLATFFPEMFRSACEVDRAGMRGSTTPCRAWAVRHVALVCVVLEQSCQLLRNLQADGWVLGEGDQRGTAWVLWRNMKDRHELRWMASVRRLADGENASLAEAVMRGRLMALFAGEPAGAHYRDGEGVRGGLR